MEVAIQGQLVANGMQPRPRDDHRLRLPLDFILDLGGEVLHHDPQFFINGVRVKLHEGLEEIFRLIFIIGGASSIFLRSRQ